MYRCSGRLVPKQRLDNRNMCMNRGNRSHISTRSTEVSWTLSGAATGSWIEHNLDPKAVMIMQCMGKRQDDAGRHCSKLHLQVVGYKALTRIHIDLKCSPVSFQALSLAPANANTIGSFHGAACLEQTHGSRHDQNTSLRKRVTCRCPSALPGRAPGNPSQTDCGM